MSAKTLKRYIKLGTLFRAIQECSNDKISRRIAFWNKTLASGGDSRTARHMAEAFRAGNSLGSAKLAADTRDSACISAVAKTQTSREGWLAGGEGIIATDLQVYNCTGAYIVSFRGLKS